MGIDGAPGSFIMRPDVPLFFVNASSRGCQVLGEEHYLSRAFYCEVDFILTIILLDHIIRVNKGEYPWSKEGSPHRKHTG
jgi:hypothetical protein